MKMKLSKHFFRDAPKKIALFLISVYQKMLSPFLGQNCRFYPSCSHYSKEAISKKGFVLGVGLAIKRILKCQPFHPGGIDEIG